MLSVLTIGGKCAEKHRFHAQKTAIWVKLCEAPRTCTDAIKSHKNQWKMIILQVSLPTQKAHKAIEMPDLRSECEYGAHKMHNWGQVDTISGRLRANLELAEDLWSHTDVVSGRLCAILELSEAMSTSSRPKFGATKRFCTVIGNCFSGPKPSRKVFRFYVYVSTHFSEYIPGWRMGASIQKSPISGAANHNLSTNT